MIDLQTYLNNAAKAHRAESLASSEQLTLGELILKLEAVQDKHLPVYFDFGDYSPTGLDSWRGSYDELALSYTASSSACFEGYVDWDNQGVEFSTSMEKPNVEQLITVLKTSLGKAFIGYKGGEYLASRRTPVWVANYGNSGVDNYKGGECETVAVSDVTIADGKVVLNTIKSEW